jgi:hypothetical protein
LKRIVVLGGSGVFGSAVAQALHERGQQPLTPSRREVDAENPAVLLAWLRPRDIVIDAAGPFQGRSTSLLEAAVKIGADVIDLSDSLDYALAVRARESQVRVAGIRVYNCCSAVSAVTAAAVRQCGIREPSRIAVCLIPASRETPSAGTAGSLLASVGRPVRVLKEGRLAIEMGWRRSRLFQLPPGSGNRRAYLTESADAATLPPIWPSLRQVDFWVDSHVFGVNAILAHAPARALAAGRERRWLTAASAQVARIAGSAGGGYVVEVEGPTGKIAGMVLWARRRSHMVAVMPAVLGATSLAAGKGPPPGVVPPDRHCDPDELFGQLRRLGIDAKPIELTPG